MEELHRQGKPWSSEIAEAVPDDFFDGNNIARDTLITALAEALGTSSVASRPEVIMIEEIDSFAAVETVSPQSVKGLSAPLALPEDKVKALIAKIIGEPFVPKDWGGERDDLFTTRVQLGGARVPASFILKGPAKKGPLTLAKLGKNGDQLDRMFNQPADLYVIQHCDQVTPAVRSHVRKAVLAARTSNPRAVASIWDGNDCARLFVAHGLIDPETGQLLH